MDNKIKFLNARMLNIITYKLSSLWYGCTETCSDTYTHTHTHTHIYIYINSKDEVITLQARCGPEGG